jgi:hypothetical protein
MAASIALAARGLLFRDMLPSFQRGISLAALGGSIAPAARTERAKSRRCGNPL